MKDFPNKLYAWNPQPMKTIVSMFEEVILKRSKYVIFLDSLQCLKAMLTILT